MADVAGSSVMGALPVMEDMRPATSLRMSAARRTLNSAPNSEAPVSRIMYFVSSSERDSKIVAVRRKISRF